MCSVRANAYDVLYCEIQKFLGDKMTTSQLISNYRKLYDNNPMDIDRIRREMLDAGRSPALVRNVIKCVENTRRTEDYVIMLLLMEKFIKAHV